MSDTAKRKGPPTKAELIKRASEMGYGRPEELYSLTVKEIREKMNLGDLNTKLSTPTETIPEVNINIEPQCEHVFRKVREIHKGGNIPVVICDRCGMRKTVG